METGARHKRPVLLTPPERLTYLRLRSMAERYFWVRSTLDTIHLGPHRAAGMFWTEGNWHSVVGFDAEWNWHTVVARRPDAIAEYHLLVQRLRAR